MEVREIWTSDALVGYSDWPHISQVCRIERSVLSKKKKRRDVSYAVTSISSGKADATRLLKLSRGHWCIENRLHWVKDVTFDEDRCQVRSGAAPQVLSAIRNTVVGLLRIAGNANIAAALRRNAASPSFALDIINRAT